MKTIQQLAAETARHFTSFKRDGSDTTVWKRSDDAPQWVTDMVYEAHGDMMPDDHKYEFIVYALDLIAGYDDTDDAYDAIEADFYNAELAAWLASTVHRHAYVDDAMQDLGASTIFKALTWGQCLERREVFTAVRDALEAQLEECDEESEGVES